MAHDGRRKSARGVAERSAALRDCATFIEGVSCLKLYELMCMNRSESTSARACIERPKPFLNSDHQYSITGFLSTSTLKESASMGIT